MLNHGDIYIMSEKAVGNDWKKIYAEALNNGYRFLSYGDGSLLIKYS